MKKFLVSILLALSATFSFSTPIAEVRHPEAGTLTLDSDKCQKAGNIANLRTPGNKEFQGCYAIYNGMVYILWDDGDKDIIPLEVFKPVEMI